MDSGIQPFGNLFNEPLQEILASEARRAFLNRTAWLRQGECSACRWWAFCHGGCPNDAYLTHKDPLRATGFCEGRRQFLERAFGAEAGLPCESEDAISSEPQGGDYLFDVLGEDPEEEDSGASRERPIRQGQEAVEPDP